MTTFKVSNVKENKEVLLTQSYSDSVRTFSKNDRIEAVSNSGDLVETKFHPFVEALHTAFAQHRPVVISPDMIWLLISQGFSTFISKNPEKMRPYLVDFEGKQELVCIRDSFIKSSPKNDWEGVFKEFAGKISEKTKNGLMEFMECGFSTTTVTEKAASQITLMEAVEPYFKYTVLTRCGIPEITLEGSCDDWRKILDKIEQLREYGFEDWYEELYPILNEFVEASRGDVNQEFWQSIYKYQSASGGGNVTGWIVEFFPHIKEIWVNTSSFSSGLSLAPFTWEYQGVSLQMNFIAGFVGFKQTEKGLRPEIGWAVTEKSNV